MSPDNLDVVRRFFEARNARDLDAVTGCLDPDAEFDLSRSRGPYRGVYRGLDEIRDALAGVLEAWGEFAITLKNPVVSGDEVVVSVGGRVKGRRSGIDWRGQGANVFTVKEGKITRFMLFQTRDDALRAAGLCE